MLARMAEILFARTIRPRSSTPARRRPSSARRAATCSPFPCRWPSKEAIDLTRLGDELIVRIGNQRRNLMLPRVLVEREVASAKLDGGQLSIFFKDAQPA